MSMIDLHEDDIVVSLSRFMTVIHGIPEQKAIIRYISPMGLVIHDTHLPCTCHLYHTALLLTQYHTCESLQTSIIQSFVFRLLSFSQPAGRLPSAARPCSRRSTIAL